MPLIKENNFQISLKNNIGNLNSCYLFYGDEVATINNTVNTIINQNLNSSSKGFNLSKFSLETCDIDDIYSAVLQAPLLSDRRIVVASAQLADKLAKSTIKAIIEMLKNLPSSTTFILSFLEPQNRSKKSVNLKDLIKNFDKYGVVVEFEKWQNSNTVNFLIDYANKEGCMLSRELAFDIIARCGNELLNLINELSKLISKANGKSIQKKDIEMLTPQNVESSAFDLANSILKGEGEKALSILNNLLNASEEPMLILGALNLTFVDLFRAKSFQIENEDISDITSLYGYKGREFRLKRAMGYAKGYSINKIIYCLKLLQEADYQSKTVATDKGFILQKTIILMIKGKI